MLLCVDTDGSYSFDSASMVDSGDPPDSVIGRPPIMAKVTGYELTIPRFVKDRNPGILRTCLPEFCHI